MLLEAGKYIYFNFSTSNVHEAMFFFYLNTFTYTEKICAKSVY